MLKKSLKFGGYAGLRAFFVCGMSEKPEKVVSGRSGY